MQKNDSISEAQKIQDAQKLKDFIEVAENMILRYVADKFSGKISIDYLKEFIENTNIGIDYNCDSHLGGYYAPLNDGAIFINSEKIRVKSIKDYFQVIGTIIHELQHKFSAEIAHKDFENKQLDEGFSDLFADECINHFLENYLGEIIKLGWSEEDVEQIYELQEIRGIHTSAYQRRIRIYKDSNGSYKAENRKTLRSRIRIYFWR